MPSSVESPLWKIVLGCIGGLFIHLVVGSVYQWGIINIYVASFYKVTEPDLRLENTGVVFPLMMTCIGIGMQPGIRLANKIGTLWTLLGIEIVAAALVLASSFIPTFVGFVAIFGAVFGLVAGMSFMLPMIECNKYLPGRRMYINGVILIGTGMSSALFGQFSYRFLNPNTIPSNLGYYDGNLTYIALKVPQCIRYLSMLYVGIGIFGCVFLYPVIRHNQLQSRANESVPNVSNVQLIQNVSTVMKAEQQANVSIELPAINVNNQTQANQTQQDLQAPQIPQNVQQIAQNQTAPAVQPPASVPDCPSFSQAFKSSVCWMLAACVVFGSCGNLLINGNYKTYVKKQITDDEYLTLIGTIGAIGNGCTRFFWNMLLNGIGFRPSIAIISVINIGVFAAINFTVGMPQLYCFMVFLSNSCLGALLVITPTICLQLYGSNIGAGIYSFYWLCFSLANFISYIYVSQLSLLIGLPYVLYVTLGMCVVVLAIVTFYKFKPDWKQPAEAVQAVNAAV